MNSKPQLYILIFDKFPVRRFFCLIFSSMRIGSATSCPLMLLLRWERDATMEKYQITKKKYTNSKISPAPFMLLLRRELLGS